ncbi:flavin reductase family protein [Kroppenstedtia pulmonis]|uniref:Flavin reductase family protein n=1 Tax=Kroppenstedtia pulmonis TaxID=1380685 RepID=A0A7D3XNT1_9BACL|nr:flavin reductase family protein [Kroppenstedtia pulmonis]QKG83267.1 flavin reductase family protein [Kroppenstedtia pulmonis]
MKSIDPQDLSERENYKFLIGGIIPRPIAFVTTLSEKGVLNGAPFSYFSIVTANPPMISVSVQRKNGSQKDTAVNAIHKQAFVVHIADETYIKALNETAASLPPDQSEVEATGLTPVKSQRIEVPGIQEAKIRMECLLEKAIPLGKDEASCDLLIGRVVHYHIAEELYDNGRINPSRLQPVSRLAGSYYARLGDMFSLERPQ